MSRGIVLGSLPEPGIFRVGPSDLWSAHSSWSVFNGPHRVGVEGDASNGVIVTGRRHLTEELLLSVKVNLAEWFDVLIVFQLVAGFR